jgi:26S proteasome regulatory subunit N1
LEALQAVPEPLSKQAIVLVKACAYAGTGNVLKIQELLQVCKEHIDPEKDDDVHQALAVLGIALIAMGEEIGAEMAIRTLNHLVPPRRPRTLTQGLTVCVSVCER